MTASLAVAAFSGVLIGFIVILTAWRRIPRVAAPDDIIELRTDFSDLAETYRLFVEQHDVEMGRHHAKVQHLRRKLRKAEGDDVLEEEEEEQSQISLEPSAARTNGSPTTDLQERKHQLRQRVLQRQ